MVGCRTSVRTWQINDFVQDGSKQDAARSFSRRSSSTPCLTGDFMARMAKFAHQGSLPHLDECVQEEGFLDTRTTVHANVFAWPLDLGKQRSNSDTPRRCSWNLFCHKRVAFAIYAVSKHWVTKHTRKYPARRRRPAYIVSRIPSITRCRKMTKSHTRDGVMGEDVCLALDHSPAIVCLRAFLDYNAYIAKAIAVV